MPAAAPITDLSEIVGTYDVCGIVPEQLDARVAQALGAAFADVVVIAENAADARGDDRPAVVLGHDLRASSPDLVAAFATGLTSRGVDVVLLGLCSIDGLHHACGSMEVAGAMFTAGHHPAEYNGITLCRSGARPVGQDSGLAAVRELAETYLAGGVPDVAGQARGVTSRRDTSGEYAGFLRSLVDLSAIRPLTVVIDAGNGMGARTVPAVLGTGGDLPALPLEVVPLHFELDGTLANHEANPLEPRNLTDLQAAVLASGADLGIAFDSDVARCFVVDELGDPVSPSAITALIGLREVERERAAGNRPTVLYNLITSQAVPDLLASAGATLVRTQVGPSSVKAQMVAHDAVFGGEHRGHYYFRELYFADSGMLAAMHVLAALGSQSGALSELAELFEPYSASGEISSRTGDVPAALERVAQAYVREQGAGPVEVDHLDGLTVRHWDATPRWWFNLRASTTGPLLRLNVEAADLDVMEKVRDDVLALVRAGAAADPKE